MRLRNVFRATKQTIQNVLGSESEAMDDRTHLELTESAKTSTPSANVQTSGSSPTTQKSVPSGGSVTYSALTPVTSGEILTTAPLKTTGRTKRVSTRSSASSQGKKTDLAPGRTHMFIPDTQVKPGTKTNHISYLGHYAVHKRPDVIVLIGDWWDMSSLSSYDVGKKSAEGKRVTLDLEAGYAAMERFFQPIRAAAGYKPEVHFFEGNHEYRLTKAVNDDAKWEGTLSFDSFKLKDFGVQVHRFLNPAEIDGVSYCHYFPTGTKGMACTSADKLLTLRHMSSVCGHKPGRDIAYATRGDGTPMTALIAGSCYDHDEAYVLQPQWHWRGFYMFHEVRDGWFDEMAVSINYLQRKAKKEGWK